jgi:hypothetical protein
MTSRNRDAKPAPSIGPRCNWRAEISLVRYLKLVLVGFVVVAAAAGLLVVTAGSVSGTVKGLPCLRVPPEACQKPMSNVGLRYEAKLGGVTSVTTTKPDGTYKIRLVPGKYQIRVVSTAGGQVLEGPNEVTVWPFGSSRADFLIPSGLQ